MPCDPTDMAMLKAARCAYLRSPACSRRLMEDYIDWLTDRLCAQASAPQNTPENTPQDAPEAAQPWRPGPEGRPA